MKQPKCPTSFKSERNQDAFIAWLLYFGNTSASSGEDYDFLHPIACKLIQVMIGETIEVKEVKIKKQVSTEQRKRIDLLIIVNNQYTIILEDKTDTSEHDKQLFNYTRDVVKEYPIRCVYYKSGNEPLNSLQNMERMYNGKIYEEYGNTDTHIAPLKILTRKDILEILTSIECDNTTLKDYIEHLNNIEKGTDSYKTKENVTKWGSRAWEGFCMDLENKLADYKPTWKHQTHNGGIEFTIPIEGTELFLQIKGNKRGKEPEKTRLRFCINGESKVRKIWRKKLVNYATKEDGLIFKGCKTALAYIPWETFFGEDKVEVVEIAYKLVDWHTKLQALAKELSTTEAPIQTNSPA